MAAAADLVARIVALVAVALAGLVAATHWAVRVKRIPPFGWWPRTVRRASDPLLQPIERRMVRVGANPQDATYWLFGLAIVSGLILIVLVRWIFGFLHTMAGLAGAGPTTWARVLIDWAFAIVMAALFVRVIAGWLRVSPYAKWMRPLIWLTEWILKPIRRFIPPVGIFDISPIVAYLALLLLRGLVMAALFT